MSDGKDWLHHDYVSVAPQCNGGDIGDAREQKARKELRVLRGKLSQAQILLDMGQKQNPDGDHSVLERRVELAQQNFDAMKVIVDAYDADREVTK